MAVCHSGNLCSDETISTNNRLQTLTDSLAIDPCELLHALVGCIQREELTIHQDLHKLVKIKSDAVVVALVARTLK